MDPLGDVLLAVHEDLGDDFFCMICTNMTYMCHILSHLALKNYFLAVLEKSLSWVMVVTLILESLLFWLSCIDIFEAKINLAFVPYELLILYRVFFLLVTPKKLKYEKILKVALKCFCESCA